MYVLAAVRADKPDTPASSASDSSAMRRAGEAPRAEFAWPGVYADWPLPPWEFHTFASSSSMPSAFGGTRHPDNAVPSNPEPRLLHISSRLVGQLVLSTVQVEAQLVVVPLASSAVPPLIHALAPMLGLQKDRSTPHCLWKQACDVLSCIPLDHSFWGESVPVTKAYRDAQVILFRTSNGMCSPLLSQLIALTVSRQIYIYDWHEVATSTADVPAAPVSMYGVSGTTWFPPLCVAWDGSAFHRLLSPSLTPFQPWVCPTLREQTVQWRLPWFDCQRCGLFGHHSPESDGCPQNPLQPSGPPQNALPSHNTDANLRLALALLPRLRWLYSVDCRSQRRRRRQNTHPTVP